MITLSQLVAWYAVLTLLALVAFGVDKALARAGARRIPERTLFALMLAGGAAGALAGMQLFRHKTRHTSFWLVGSAALVAHLGIIGYLVASTRI